MRMLDIIKIVQCLEDKSYCKYCRVDSISDI